MDHMDWMKEHRHRGPIRFAFFMATWLEAWPRISKIGLSNSEFDELGVKKKIRASNATIALTFSVWQLKSRPASVDEMMDWLICKLNCIVRVTDRV